MTGVIKSQSTMVKTIHSLPFTTYYSFAKLLSRLMVTMQWYKLHGGAAATTVSLLLVDNLI